MCRHDRVSYRRGMIAETVPVRLDFDAHAPAFARAMSDLDDAAVALADEAGLDAQLRELVRLRASQVNGCAYCVDLHARDARRAGASAQRVDAVAVWPESGLFDAAERAGLALAEAMTQMSRTRVPEPVLTEAVAVHGEQATAALVALVVAVGMWNGVGVSTRCWPVSVRSHD